MRSEKILIHNLTKSVDEIRLVDYDVVFMANVSAIMAEMNNNLSSLEMQGNITTSGYHNNYNWTYELNFFIEFASAEDAALYILTFKKDDNALDRTI